MTRSGCLTGGGDGGGGAALGLVTFDCGAGDVGGADDLAVGGFFSAKDVGAGADTGAGAGAEAGVQAPDNSASTITRPGRIQSLPSLIGTALGDRLIVEYPDWLDSDTVLTLAYERCCHPFLPCHEEVAA